MITLPKTPLLLLAAIALLSFPGLTPKVRAQSLSTLFSGGNQNSIGGGNYFDANVTSGITVTSLAVAATATAGTAINLEVWVRMGTAFGFETSTAGWMMVATGAGIAAGPGGTGANGPSPITLSNSVTLGAGVTGFAIKNVNYGASYTNGNGSNQSYSNGDLSLALGTATNTFLTGSAFSPRVWNGTINYTTAPVGVPESGASSFALLALSLIAVGAAARRFNPAVG